MNVNTMSLHKISLDSRWYAFCMHFKKFCIHLHEIAFNIRKGVIILKHGYISFTEESSSMLLAWIHRWKKGKSLLNKEQKLSSFHCKTYRGNNKSPLCSEPFGYKTTLQLLCNFTFNFLGREPISISIF